MNLNKFSLNFENKGKLHQEILNSLQNSFDSKLEFVQGTIYIQTTNGPVLLALSYNTVSDNSNFLPKHTCSRSSNSKIEKDIDEAFNSSLKCDVESAKTIRKNHNTQLDLHRTSSSLTEQTDSIGGVETKVSALKAYEHRKTGRRRRKSLNNVIVLDEEATTKEEEAPIAKITRRKRLKKLDSKKNTEETSNFISFENVLTTRNYQQNNTKETTREKLREEEIRKYLHEDIYEEEDFDCSDYNPVDFENLPNLPFKETKFGKTYARRRRLDSQLTF
ncbi:DgyrCDS8022 [Dimorphilus gyrociliatus]|uniref:DgyrCDS8022 n=1 Tax=Dimorphilus gyrociliatus TaxID=2664684 RepID=A0A7I8VUL6_9ANNE|nr:DgyrCDS8022 [Dimorphilus gyrociliatus]